MSRSLYSPRLSDDVVRALYREGRRRRMPMPPAPAVPQTLRFRPARSRACKSRPMRIEPGVPRSVRLHAGAGGLRAACLGVALYHCHAEAADPAPSPNRAGAAPAASVAIKSPKRVAAETECGGMPLAGLIRALGDERFFLRECAEERLHELLHESRDGGANEVEGACYSVYLAEADPEIRCRVRAVLTDFAVNLWSPKGFLGLAAVPDMGFDEHGEVVSLLKVNKLAADGPAAKAGLKTGDLIHHIDQLGFKDAGASGQFDHYLATKRPGDTVVLDLERAEQRLKTHVTLGSKPRSTKAADKTPQPAPDPERCFREYLTFKTSDP